MDVSPEIEGYDESFSEEDENLCRICRSPEEPGNPLRYPCSCRGSIKYVHEDCLRIWLNRRGNTKCEVCGRSYSFVPVYSENAPERLSCYEFVIEVLVRVAHYLKLIVLWIAVILFNTFCASLHTWGELWVVEAQSEFMSRMLTYLWVNFFYSSVIACSILLFSVLRIEIGDFRVGGLPGWFLADGEGGVVAGVSHFLWKYLKILVDWYFFKLMHYLGQPHRVILVPPVTLLDEFGVFRRLLFFFDDHVFAGLATSVYFCTLLVLLPFSAGWVVSTTVGSSYLSGKPPLVVGYLMVQLMLSIRLAYFGILYILHQCSLAVIVRWLLLRFHFITVTLPCHLLAFLVKACKNILLIKDAFVLILKISALPWIVGWFLEICTSPMFGTRSFQIFEIFAHNPCMTMAFRWLLGLSCLMIAVTFMEHIQKIIHKRAFWYLLDVTDPEYKITKLNLRHILFVFAFHGVLLVILFRLPIKAITLIIPSFFPLELWDTDESPYFGAACAIYFNLMHAGPRWLITLTKPAIELILDKWIITVSSWLQLSDLLLVVPRGEDFHRADENVMPPRMPYDDDPWVLLYSLAEGSIVTVYKSQNDEDDIKEQRHSRYRTRIAIMLFLAALNLFLIFIIPGLLGLLIDLMIIIPLRVPPNETPLYFLIQDWLIGVVVVHIWTFLTMLTPIKCFATKAWRRKFERIRNVGLKRVPSMWLLRDVIGSIINTLLTTLSIPYVLVKSLLPLLGFSQTVVAATERFIWPASLGLIVIWFMTKLTLEIIVYLHQLIFNEREIHTVTSFAFPKMDVSPEVDDYDKSFSAEEEEEDEDLCRICRSPEKPENPLRYPCSCRGSIKFVHQDCLRTWLNRRGNNKCEVCGRSYSFVPVYSENAPERLSCYEFLLGVLSRIGRYLKMIVPWIVLILLNSYFVSLHPWSQGFVPEFEEDDLSMSRKLAYISTGLLYSAIIVCSMTVIAVIRLEVGDVYLMRFIGNGGFVQFFWKYMKILCDWYFHKLIQFLGQPPRLIFLPPEAPLHEFGVIRRLLFFLDDDAFALLAISVYVSIIFVLLPVWIGRIVLATVGGSYFSGYSDVILGYMMMLSVCLAYIGFLFTLHQNLFPVMVGWLSLGVHFVAMKLPCLLWGFSVKSCKSMKSLVGFGISQASLPDIFQWFSLGFHFITVILPSFLWVSSAMACKSMQSLVGFGIRQASLTAILQWLSLGFHFITVILPSFLWASSAMACKSMQCLVSFGIRKASLPDIFQWFSLGFHFITVTLPRFLWVSSVVAFQILVVVKEVSVFCFKIGVLPWLIGYWLGICTSPLFGTIFSESFEAVSHLPFMMFIRWSSGIVCLVIAESCMHRIQQIVHKRAIWYLLDVTDPNYQITKLNFCHTFFALASHGVLLVFLFHLPIRAISLISPSFFPLELWMADENLSAAAHAIYFQLLTSSPKWLFKLVKPAMELLVQKWIITVSSWLDLSDFFLVVRRREDLHRADQNMRPRRPWLLLFSIAEGSLVILNGSQKAEDDTNDQRDNRFLLRIALMVVLAAVSMFVVSTAFMALPIFLGRGFLESISFIMLRIGLKRDDLLAFWIGYIIIGQTYTATCFVSDQIQKGRFDLLLKDVCMWIRNGLLFSIWISVIPVLLGLLIELMIIIPLRVPLNESPVHFLIQDWLIGVVVLHIWVFLTMLTRINWLATEAWLRKLEIISNAGVNRLPSTWLLRDVIGSIINTLLTTLSVPYLLVKLLFPLLGFSESVTSTAERLIWPSLLALVAVWVIARITRDFIIYVHQLVFNERYLVGEILDNLTEEEIEQPI
ncbi:unnamed protein product [Eruca vesicaria subsp. sativa]|uniref:RING-CH-type domain-containing protein n=1 Tax=Eruca vesicaria subsp. sativa TaxID=29727 RepID=A0ABC8KDU5_ERUVS|nr:unnamed protein product [Eruca vesicaria subsp. sativa]